jgi:hypothetical protein
MAGSGERCGQSLRRAISALISLLGKWRRFLPYLGGIAALLLFAAALVILHIHAQA